MSGFENSMLDFDINYLLQPPDNASKAQADKLRKQILHVKKRAISINAIINKHNVYREKFEEKDVMLQTANKELKKVCIEYQELLEKYTQIEKELDRLKTQNAELDSKCTLSQNQYEGMKSHANQLQVLIKEHESVIQALKVEKHLEKNNSDDYEKDLAAKEKQIEVTLKHLSIAKDIALGKKKLRKRHKVLLQKYDHLKNCSSEEDSSSDSGSDQPDFVEVSSNSPLLTSPIDSAGDKVKLDVIKPNKMEICIKKDSARLNEDNDSDCSNEVVSEDTGRGSSLAFSDGEKCFNSPDYFSNDSPITKEISQVNEQKTFMDSGTSPMRSDDVDHIPRNPRILDDEAAFSDSDMHFHNESDVNSLEYFITDIPLSNEIVTIKEKRKLIDIGTSPIKNLEKVNIATSPLFFEGCVELNERDAPDYSQCESNINTRKSPCILIDDTETGVKGKHTTIDSLESHCELEISGKSSSLEERKCLERNNSKIFCDENSNEGEIEMIFNNMRLTHRLITPIPQTPVKIHKNECRKVPDIIVQKPDNLVLQDQYKTIMTSIFDLKKEWMDMKCFIMNNLSNNGKSNVEISNESNISVTTEIFDDTSQETIIINANDDHTNGYEESEITQFNLSNVLRNEVIESDILKQTTAACVPSLQDVLMINETLGSIDKPIEKELGAVSINNDSNVNKKDSREAITFEEDLSSEDDSDIIKNVQDLSKICRETKMLKKKNLSKLDKFKQKLLPKSKISKLAPIRKLRSKTNVTPVINKETKMDPTAILNNKSAYENAAKVMAEIKSKEKVLANKRIVRKVKKKVGGKKDHDCFEQKHHTPKDEENNPEKHIRQRSKDQLDVHLESIEDDNPQIVFSPITTRSRSRKLSSNCCGSPIQIDKREQVTSESEEKRKRLKRGATDSPIGDCKRVLRSSTNRNTFIDLDNVKKNVSTYDVSETDSDSPLRPNYKLSPSTHEKQNICGSVKNFSNTYIKIQHRKLSNSENEEQNSKVKKVPNMPSKIQDRKFSNNENEEQNSNVKKVPNMPSKIQDRKFSNDENEEQNNKVKKVPIMPSKIQDRKFSNNENEEQNSKVKKVPNMPSKIQDRKFSNNDNEEQNNKVKKVPIMPSNIQDRKFSNNENEEQNSKVKKVPNMPSKIQDRKFSKNENEERNSKVENVSISPNTVQDLRELSIILVDTMKEPDKSTELDEFDQMDSQISHPKQSILCRMLEKHGRGDKKFSSKKVSDQITNSICKKLEEGIAVINELPAGKVKAAMNKLVEEVQTWNYKHFLLGFMKYLKDPDRKRELFNKVNSPPAPPMTKPEQVLLYVVKQMETQKPNTVNTILTHIEYSLFQLNRTPEFDIIESVSHFYALLCRYFGLKSRLRLFLLDAMYCVQFKVVPLIKQCLDVWMHILPLAHMGIAKSPLVTCLVYLLHFYKCDDRFNRVTEIRTILNRKYFYEMADWNETKILEMIKNAIKDVRDVPIEKKMLRTALIILGKRHGAKWCHKNIIKNILMPMIEQEDISMKIKQFCVQLLGALLKPFPADMKVHFEIAVNHLHDMLQQDPPDAMKEAIFTSLIYINHHNPNRVIRLLLSWMPKQISPEFEQLLRDYVRTQPLRAWKKILSKISM